MSQKTYQDYLEPVIEEFTTGENYKEVYQAKQEYFEKAGIVYEDDPEFEQRMSIFMDWYLFDRDLPGSDLPPIKLYARRHASELSPEDTKVFQSFCETRHSIFRLKRFTFFKRVMVVTDLFSQKSFHVTPGEMTRGFARGDIFEARLIPFQGGYEFSRGFCFHPREMSGFILGEIKKVRFQDRTRHTKLILQLSAMKLNHLRFPHIDMTHIYRLNSRFDQLAQS